MTVPQAATSGQLKFKFVVMHLDAVQSASLKSHFCIQYMQSKLVQGCCDRQAQPVMEGCLFKG